MGKNKEKEFLNEGIKAIRSKEYIHEFEGDYLNSLDHIATDNNKMALAISIFEQIKIKADNSSNPVFLSLYPEFLSSLLLVDRHYDAIKDTDPKYLETLSYATFYLTGNKTEDMVSLFGDGLIISKLRSKTRDRQVILNAMGNFLGRYQKKDEESKEDLKARLISYTQAASPSDLSSLEPLYKMNDELMKEALKIIFPKPDKGGQTK